MSELGPCILEGKVVRLEPLTMEHARDLLAAAQDSDWSWMTVDGTSEAGTVKWMQAALMAQEKGTEYPFVVRQKATDTIVGSTRYMDVRPAQKGVEIGWTWYSGRVWSTAVNPECKYLLMRHAFEDWGAIRVQLKTDNNNVHSQRAIMKLGAKFEGRLRNHRVRLDGSPGDSMMYSVTVQEWTDGVRNDLQRRIESLTMA